ncbi:MAG: sulfate transporter, permease protein CysW [Pseudomonadota bacterium]|jgi:sulfate transport system permease protein
MARGYRESAIARTLMVVAGIGYIGLMVALPLTTVFYFAFKDGFNTYIEALSSPASIGAIKLTLIVGFSALILNTIFGLAISWAICKFDFAYKRFYIAIIDLPFTISPVISGMVFVLLFGASGFFGSYLIDADIKIVFSTPGIILATTFVTLPFIARSLISLMSTQGREEEEAAATLGAGFWTIYKQITLPNIKWALFYGMTLCFARGIGDFGAVTVVAGPLRTVTIEIFDLYNEYNTAGAFALASVLTFVALIALGIKKVIEKYHAVGGGIR